MKPYFAKYIPVEGEINPGDYGLTEHSGYVFKALPETMSLCKGRQKVKLFLCSRKIEIGDEVQYQMEGFKLCKGKFTSIDEEGGVKSYTVTGDGCIYEFYPDDLEVSPLSEHPFKIIGEISPDATWVVEGDEFNEDEVDIYDVSHLPVNVCHIKGSDNQFY